MRKFVITILLVTLLVSLSASVLTASAIETEPKFFLLQQSDTNYIVAAIQGAESAADYYDFYSASGHTPYMEDLISKIYVYEDTTTGEISLIIHHSIDDSASSYMRVDFDLQGVPVGTYVALSDDESHVWPGGPSSGQEFDLGQEPEGSWEFYYNSDGGVLSYLPTAETWTITITPNFIQGITAWKYQETTNTIPLDMSEPIIISSDLSNVSPDPDLDLSFGGLSGGGSIGVTKLTFGSTTPIWPSPFFDIQVTVQFGTAQICMSYDDEGMSKGQEKQLRLWTTERIIQGDVNFDGKVDGKDISAINQAIRRWFTPWDPNINNNGHGNGWNPYCDINEDGDINEEDLNIALSNYGQEEPWIDITTNIDTVNNIICGETTQFSIFRCR